MGKTANAKRRAIFADLEERGIIPPRVRKPKKPRTPRIEKPKPHPFAWCCLIKYGESLPVGFKTCPDCPLDKPEPEA